MMFLFKIQLFQIIQHNTTQNTYKLPINTNNELVPNVFFVSAVLTDGMALDQEAIFSKPIKKQNSETVNYVHSSL